MTEPIANLYDYLVTTYIVGDVLKMLIVHSRPMALSNLHSTTLPLLPLGFIGAQECLIIMAKLVIEIGHSILHRINQSQLRNDILDCFVIVQFPETLKKGVVFSDSFIFLL